MEAKYLALKGKAGKVDTVYMIQMSVPKKIDLSTQLNIYPFHIQTDQDTTFKTGPLAYAQHSIHVSIYGGYEGPQIGINIKLQPNKGDLISVTEINGRFDYILPTDVPTSYDFSFSNKNAQVAQVFAGSASHLGEAVIKRSLGYDYWESKCSWPTYNSELKIFIKITKHNYCSIVADKDNIEMHEKPRQLKGMIDTKPYFMSDSCSDVKIIAGESEIVYPGHKVILSSKSKYFAAMFNTPMREATEGRVTIPDIDAILMEELLRFMYLGEVQDLEGHAKELLILSDKYEIDELKSLSIQYLIGNVNVDNSMEMYDLSSSIGGGDRLRDKSKQTILWNRKTFIEDMDNLHVFTTKYPELFVELLRVG